MSEHPRHAVERLKACVAAAEMHPHRPDGLVALNAAEARAILSALTAQQTATAGEAERFMDAVDAYARADAWVESVATAEQGPHREIRRIAFAGEDGGAIIYVNAGRVRAAALVVRDDLNFSVSLRMMPGRDAVSAQTATAVSREEIARMIRRGFINERTPVEIADAICALLDGGGGSWRPIETARCDGTDILVSAPSWDGVVVRDWKSADAACEDLANWLDPPTHWMPTPTPPAKPRTSEEAGVGQAMPEPYRTAYTAGEKDRER